MYVAISYNITAGKKSSNYLTELYYQLVREAKQQLKRTQRYNFVEIEWKLLSHTQVNNGTRVLGLNIRTPFGDEELIHCAS